jgi:hypothetical protein
MRQLRVKSRSPQAAASVDISALIDHRVWLIRHGALIVSLL